MYVKSVTENIKDIFLGKGWDKWIRIDLDEKKVINTNINVTPSILKSIFAKVHK